MDAFQLCLALGPLAIYFLLVGALNFARRPLVVGGGREIAALGLALSGLVIVGPMQLFMPQAAAAQFHGYVWMLLLAFYASCVLLWMLLVPPRLVIFNMTLAELRPLLAELAQTLDPESRWAGDSLTLPQLGIQLHLQEFPSMRNVSLVSSGGAQSFRGWRGLEIALRERLRTVEVPPNPGGVTLVASGLIMLSALVFRVWDNPQALARGFFELIQR